ncbi:DUF6230 family protein [Lentzea sp. NPDC004789]
MLTEEDRRAGHTSWRRFLVIVAPTVAAATGLVCGIANGAVPVSFANATPFRVTVERIDANGFGFTPGMSQQTGALAIRTSLSGATVTGMCQSQTVELPVIGAVTMKVTAKTVHATNLVIDAHSASGQLDLQKLVIGPTDSVTGYRSDAAVLEKVTIEAGSATAGTFAADDVNITIRPGAAPCPVPAP